MSGGQARQWAVQRARRRSWQTLTLRPDKSGAEAFFAQAVAKEPRAVLRLIQVDFKSDSNQAEFDWLLVTLHDPRKLGLTPAFAPEESERKPPESSRPPVRHPARHERVRAPLRLWGLFFLAGIALTAVGLGVWRMAVSS